MKISFFNSMKVRIIIAVVIMVSVPFGILQLGNMFLVYNKLTEKTYYTTEALAHSVATNVEEFMRGVFDASQTMALDERIVNGGEAGRLVLEEAVKRMPYFGLIYVQGMDGMQTIRSAGKLMNRSDRWWFKKIKSDPSPFISEAYVSVNNNELVTSLFIPMYNKQKFSGVFGADFKLETVQNAAGPYLSKDISFIVMDSKGSVLAGSDYRTGEYINYIDYTKRTPVLDDNGRYKLDENGYIVTRVEKIQVSDTMKRIISGALDSKTESYQFRDNNNIVVCAYQPIQLPGKSLPWSVVVFQKQTDSLSLVLLIVMFILLLVISVFATIKLINLNILNPVIKIQRSMSRIAGGELGLHIEISKNNEIGELAGDINKMADSLKMQQQKIDENEKLAALGNLVAGVAHEINTPLGIGVTTSTYMKKINDECRIALNEGKFTKNDLLDYMESMNESLDLLQYNLERGSKIIRSFKQVAIDETSDSVEEFNVLQCINNVIVSLTHEYKKSNHAFSIECDEKLAIKSHPGVLAQILTNFIMNSVLHAFDEMENGLMRIVAYKENGIFTLSYSDNGCGISEENLRKIFKPFFTTKKNSGGSGLGLNIVHDLVTKKLNGTIEVESWQGTGTTFTIKIPV